MTVLTSVYGVKITITMLDSGNFKVTNVKTGTSKEYSDRSMCYSFWNDLYYNSGYEVP